MTRRRIRAALADWGLVLGWAVALAAVGVSLHAAGFLANVPLLWLGVAGGALVAVPAILVLTLTEGGRYEASPGKQLAGLRVRRPDGRQAGYGRALVRNLLKVGLPWLLGHTAGIVLATSPPPLGTDVLVLAGVAYLLPLYYLVSLFGGEHRTAYDLLSGTQVIATQGARRVAEDG